MAKKSAKRKKVGKKAPKVTTAAKASKKRSRNAKTDARPGMHPNSQAALKKFQRKPGQPSLNPSGRPKGRTLTTMLRLIVDEEAPGGKTNGELILDMAVKMARAGQYQFFKEIFDRLDGKVPDRVMTEITKQFVDDEVSKYAALMIGATLDVAAEYLDPEQLESFGEKLAGALADLPAVPEAEGDDEELV